MFGNSAESPAPEINALKDQLLLPGEIERLVREKSFLGFAELTASARNFTWRIFIQKPQLQKDTSRQMKAESFSLLTPKILKESPVKRLYSL